MDDQFVGSLTTPTSSAVADAAKHLRCEVAKTRAGRNAGFPLLMRLHNAFACYTALLLAFACGARNCESYGWRASLDRHHWFCYFNDKKNGPWHQPQPMLLADTVRAQAALFRAHCEALLGRVERRSLGTPTLRQQLRAVISGEEVPLLFIIDACGAVAKLGTADVLRSLPKDILLAPDAGRHSLATFLFQQGVEDPLIDYFLRHAEAGVEPQSSTTVISLRYARDFLNPLIDRHLGDLGLTSLSGLAAD